MNAIKRLSEVCKIVGVTRRTMQEYNKVGLLKPTSTTETGYWLYDDAAIQKLILIQIFVEVGYERKTIKALLESPSLDMLYEFDCLINTLEKKRKRIDGMIRTIKTLKLAAKLPESILRAVGNVDVTRIYRDKSFASYLAKLKTIGKTSLIVGGVIIIGYGIYKAKERWAEHHHGEKAV